MLSRWAALGLQTWTVAGDILGLASEQTGVLVHAGLCTASEQGVQLCAAETQWAGGPWPAATLCEGLGAEKEQKQSFSEVAGLLSLWTGGRLCVLRVRFLVLGTMWGP